ncbi:MAG TPA: YgjV family protein, partial [Polyangiaceae bacterium]|nr:YgjV family protein [Polyangiaceae bacterium]
MPPFDFAQLISPAQLSGYAAFVLGVTAFLQREDRRLKLFLVGECLAYAVHFTLLGNLPAASSAGVSGARTFLSIRLRSRWLALVFMVIYLIFGIALHTTGAQWLPVIGAGVATWGMF